jgi:hypothetical protein
MRSHFDNSKMLASARGVNGIRLSDPSAFVAIVISVSILRRSAA